MQISEMPAAGARVQYRAISGYLYPALVISTRPGALLDIDVDAVRPPLRLSKRPWWAGEPNDCPLRACCKVA